MSPDYAVLPHGQEPMPLERWEIHKSCEASQRSHKWQWVAPASNDAICVHCGKVQAMHRPEGEHG